MGVINGGFCETIQVGPHTYNLLGFSVCGSPDKINQDSFGFLHEDDCIIAVIADGLGSAPLSQIGSRNMVRTIFEIMSEPEPVDIWKQISETWKSSLQGEPEQYDTTCKFICIRDENVIMGSIGDGWLGFTDKNGYHELDNESIFTNVTSSICSPDMMEKATLIISDTSEIPMIGISTDGFSEDLDENSRCDFLHDTMDILAINPRGLYSEIITTMHNWPIESNKDDKTLVLLRRVE